MGFGVFSAELVFRFSLVGGNYNNGTNAGLWLWNLNNTSSNTNGNLGARLLIFIDINIGIWCVLYLGRSLLRGSAVIGIIQLMPACGIGD